MIKGNGDGDDGEGIGRMYGYVEAEEKEEKRIFWCLDVYWCRRV